MSQLKSLKAIASGVRLKDKKNPYETHSKHVLKEAEKCSTTINQVVNSHRRSTPLTPMASAFSLFG